MIAIDTNILVYAHREESPWHSRAAERVKFLAESNRDWAIPWPCLHEFLAKVTHPSIFVPPTTVSTALDFVAALMGAPRVSVLHESDEHLSVLGRLMKGGKISGARVHDARIAAICIGHGVDELWTADRDFGRFPELSVHNPLVE